MWAATLSSTEKLKNYQAVYYFFAFHNTNFDFKTIITNLQRIKFPSVLTTKSFIYFINLFLFSLALIQLLWQTFTFNPKVFILSSISHCSQLNRNPTC